MLKLVLSDVHIHFGTCVQNRRDIKISEVACTLLNLLPLSVLMRDDLFNNDLHGIKAFIFQLWEQIQWFADSF